MGQGRTIMYDATQGRYWVRDYDRTAMVEASMWKDSGNPIAAGTIGKLTGAVLTYIGDDMLWFYQPEDCLWSLHEYNRDASGAGPLLGRQLAAGDMCKPPTCAFIENCEDCTSQPTCGWCGKENKCMVGMKEKPCPPLGCGVEFWRFQEGTCPGPPCNTHKLCSDCVSDPFCGWCMDFDTCAEGNKDNPFLTACGEWRHYQCPKLSNRADDGSLCPPMPYEPPFDISFLQTYEGISEEAMSTILEAPNAHKRQWTCKHGQWFPVDDMSF